MLPFAMLEITQAISKVSLRLEQPEITSFSPGAFSNMANIWLPADLNACENGVISAITKMLYQILMS